MAVILVYNDIKEETERNRAERGRGNNEGVSERSFDMKYTKQEDPIRHSGYNQSA
jgi:hypothetical protein